MNSTLKSRVVKLGAMSLLVCLGTACGESVRADLGFSEPIRIQGAQFFPGEWSSKADGPTVASVDLKTTFATVGTRGKHLEGLIDAADGVALRLKGLGTGYWVVPADLPDQFEPGKLTWKANMDIDQAAPLGDQTLQFAAVGDDKNFGPTTERNFTLQPDVPAGAKVISLVWGNRADLDIHVRAPSGKELSPKRLNTGVVPEAGLPDAGLPGSGTLSRDANGGCDYDGYMREDVIFTDAPEAGTYEVRVDMFSACGEPSATFRVELWEEQKLRSTRGGVLLGSDADSGQSAGIFIKEFSF